MPRLRRIRRGGRKRGRPTVFPPNSKESEIGVTPLPFPEEGRRADGPRPRNPGASPNSGVGVEARLVACMALHRVERDGAWLNRLWGELFARFPTLSDADRALAGELALGVLRRRESLDRMIAQLVDRPLPDLDPRALTGLRVGLYQLEMLDRVPPHAAVSTTVGAVEQLTNKRLAGYVNACLRTFLRRRDRGEMGSPGRGALGIPPGNKVPPAAGPHIAQGTPEADTSASTLDSPPIPTSRPTDRQAARKNISHGTQFTGVPAWLDAMLGQIADDELPAFQLLNPPPTSHNDRREALRRWIHERATPTLRVNRIRISRDAYLAELRRRSFPAEPGSFSPDAVVFRGPVGDPARIPGFAEGWVFVQDESAQLVVEMLDPQPGMRVLEIGAAPGGKSTHIAERMNDQGLVVALDKHGHKRNLIRDNAHRMGLRCIQPVVGGAEHPSRQVPAGTFDRVLLDAPCSGLGVIRRHPEAQWMKQGDQVRGLAILQAKLLHYAAQYVAPGGDLVYSVCTFTIDEGPKQVRRFLNTHTNFALVDPAQATAPANWHRLLRGEALQTTGVSGLDGFFAVRMRRIDDPGTHARALGRKPPRGQRKAVMERAARGEPLPGTRPFGSPPSAFATDPDSGE